MRKRAISLLVASAAFLNLVGVPPAAAACRPTTLATLFPTPAPSAPVPSPMLPADAASTTTTAAPTPVESSTTTAPAGSAPDPAAPTATATTTPPPAPSPPAAPCAYVYRMQWPVLGGGAVLSVFGADRDGGARRHAGVDVAAHKLAPVVAVRDGTVSGVHDDPGDCCWVTLKHDDGWSSAYLHLNNDVDGSDNGAGVGIRPDLITGMRVAAGEVIGWVGDSGNAEPGIPHLHFELHTPGGIPIDPLASLRWALRRMPAPALPEGYGGFEGAFLDDEDQAVEPVFDLLVSTGAIAACDTWGAAVCPHSAATNRDAATWVGALTRVLVPTMTATPAATIEETIIELRICTRAGCETPPVTFGEVAAMLWWVVEQRLYDEAVASAEAAGSDEPRLVASPPIPYWAIDRPVALARLIDRGMADDCPMTTPPLDAALTRAGLAEMIGKALGYLPVVNCGQLA